MMKINLIVIKSAKITELSHFYSLLGCDFEYHQHGQGVFHYAANIEGLIFEIYPLSENILMADNTTRLGFEVENLDNLIEKLAEKGINLFSPAKKTAFGYVAIVQDPDGRKVEILEKKV